MTVSVSNRMSRFLSVAPLLAVSLAAHAESVLEFKTAGPVTVAVDGRQATLTSNMRQRVSGLEPGVHTLVVSGVFGKTLYEAEIDIPDNTITTAEWSHGEVSVISTDWLEAPAAAPLEQPAPPAEEAPPEVIDVAPPPPPVAEEVADVPMAIPAGRAAPVAGAPATPPAAPAAATEEPLPVVAVPPPKRGTAMPPASKPRTLTVQATDGMKIDVVYQGRVLTVVVDGDQFRIEDASGTVVALGTE